jgi:uncharacterized glyoxalase superfamily protein PhnB
MKPAQNNILLELHIPDFQKAKDYYQKLGFEIVWERKPEDMKGYLVMKIANNILCFWSGNEAIYESIYFKKFPKDTKNGYGVEIVIMVDELNAYYEKVKKFANIVEELTLQPWGAKDFRVEDPFGFYIRFSTPHNILDKESNAVK